MVPLMALTSALELAVLMASLLGLLMVDLSEFELDVKMGVQRVDQMVSPSLRSLCFQVLPKISTVSYYELMH